MYPQKELNYIRDLAKKTAEHAYSDIINKRRKLWASHNSLQPGRPLFHVRSIPGWDFMKSSDYFCSDTYLRNLEYKFLIDQYRMKLADDYITEPFMTIRAAVKTNPDGVWGLSSKLGEKSTDFGAAAFNPSIINESDIERLNVADYEIDEIETSRQYNKMHEIFHDILKIDIDRQGALCSIWNSDISTMLARLRGLEQIMLDVYDRPEWFHKLLSFMRDNILKNIDQTQAAGGFALINHENQSMPYSEELAPPKVNAHGVNTSELWGFFASQEYTTFSTPHFDEFMLQYQIPIIERYGLSAYGCCEDLTHKISVLRRIKNLRRIAVTPWANTKLCAEQIGKDYVLSWRPNPSDAVSRGIDETFIRSELREVFDIFDSNSCVFDITLKDVETVAGDPNSIIQWCSVVRDEINKRYC